MISLSLARVKLKLKHPFRISRGTKTHVDLIRVSLSEKGVTGRGECCPYARYNETLESVTEALEKLKPGLEAGFDRKSLPRMLPAGAARNALDCALYDFEAKKTGVPVYQRLELPRVDSFQTFRTITIATPEAMAGQAKVFPKRTPLKIKLDRDLVAERLSAIKTAASESPLMVDANEGWTPDFLQAAMPVLREFGVILVEQPLPAGEDEALWDMARPIPVLADEACHTAADIPGLARKYDAVNIKLDKTGGLTGALELLDAAKKNNLKIMLGCMVSSSLSIAPISHLCSHAQFIDLDGPLLLKHDRPGGMKSIPETPDVALNSPWGRP